MKYIDAITTRSYYIDRSGKLSISFMLYLMQEIAWKDANLLGFGYSRLKEKNQFWVLSRLKVKINRRPCWTEQVNLETWSRGTDGFYGYRDFSFTDKAGVSVIQATSSWLVLDANTKRIIRLSSFSEFPEYAESVFGTNASKVKSPVSDQQLVYSPVLFNEIDINQHFNSGKYLERIMNDYSFEFHQKHELLAFEINFLKEGLPNDRLAVKKQDKDMKNHLCSVVRENDGSELIRSHLTWETKAVQ